MKKTVINNTTITVVLQNAEDSSEQCLNGVISVDPDKKEARFEEVIRKGRPPRNPKLYDGKFISVVRMQNGKYQCHLKTFNPSKDLDRNELAFAVYSELLSAFNNID